MSFASLLPVDNLDELYEAINYLRLPPEQRQ